MWAAHHARLSLTDAFLAPPAPRHASPGSAEAPGTALESLELTLRLGDCGLARLRRAAQAHGQDAPDAQLYASPEDDDGFGPSAPADMWALGCVAYELAAGRPPFLGVSADALARRRATEPPPALPTRYSAALRELVGELLDKAPARRPTAADVLARSFDAEAPPPRRHGAAAGAAAESEHAGGRASATPTASTAVSPAAERRAAPRTARARLPLGELLDGSPLSSPPHSRLPSRSDTPSSPLSPPSPAAQAARAGHRAGQAMEEDEEEEEETTDDDEEEDDDDDILASADARTLRAALAERQRRRVHAGAPASVGRPPSQPAAQPAAPEQHDGSAAALEAMRVRNEALEAELASHRQASARQLLAAADQRSAALEGAAALTAARLALAQREEALRAAELALARKQAALSPHAGRAAGTDGGSELLTRSELLPELPLRPTSAPPDGSHAFAPSHAHSPPPRKAAAAPSSASARARPAGHGLARPAPPSPATAAVAREDRPIVASPAVHAHVPKTPVGSAAGSPAHSAVQAAHSASRAHVRAASARTGAASQPADHRAEPGSAGRHTQAAWRATASSAARAQAARAKLEAAAAGEPAARAAWPASPRACSATSGASVGASDPRTASACLAIAASGSLLRSPRAQALVSAGTPAHERGHSTPRASQGAPAGARMARQHSPSAALARTSPRGAMAQQQRARGGAAPSSARVSTPALAASPASRARTARAVARPGSGARGALKQASRATDEPSIQQRAQQAAPHRLVSSEDATDAGHATPDGTPSGRPRAANARFRQLMAAEAQRVSDEARCVVLAAAANSQPSTPGMLTPERATKPTAGDGPAPSSPAEAAVHELRQLRLERKLLEQSQRAAAATT